MLSSGGRVKMATAYLGLGSNMGEREINLLKALSLLGQETQLIKTSSIYETEPVGYEKQASFLNMVCQVCTKLKPVDLLRLVKQIEENLGRKSSFRNAPRIIDIDILLYDNTIMKMRDLVIPHPRLVERAFALIPLAEITTELAHPELGRSIAELAHCVTGQEGVRKFKKEVP
jgi:2-amino-4-hydroxy-6-hydroxymethyldihydropteridine diphosphokinase